MPTKARRTTVRLTGIAQRSQGTHDSLCAYYSAAMLLCALRPEYDEQFDAAHVGLDPLFGNLPRTRGTSVEGAVAEWLASGVRLDSLARALDRAGATGKSRARTRFVYRRATRGDDTVDFLRRQIDRGLPCILGWESRELGDHTSLVVGYDRYAGSTSQWLRLADPIRTQALIEWGQLRALAKARLELIVCTAHDGVRPDKLTVTRDGSGQLVGNRIERWDPRADGWQTIVPVTANERTAAKTRSIRQQHR
jgi:hypothetical protein